MSRSLLLWVILAWPVGVYAADTEIVNGLKTEIFADQRLGRLIASRIDPNIDSHWASASPAEGTGKDGFSIRWTGWIRAPRKGQYELIVSGEDGYRLWVDDRPIMDNWVDGWHKKSVSIEMTGEAQTFKMEYLMKPPGGAWMTLRWRPVGSKDAQIVPSEAFFPTEESAKAKPAKRLPPPKNGLVVEYYDVNFKRRFGTGRVHRTETMWEESPVPGVPENAGARYSGYLIPPKSGRYRFVAFGDDRIKVLLNGKPLVETTYDKGEVAAYMDLEAGKACPLMIEFQDFRAWGFYYLHWVPPGGTTELSIPPECLFPNKQSLPKETAK